MAWDSLGRMHLHTVNKSPDRHQSVPNPVGPMEITESSRRRAAGGAVGETGCEESLGMEDEAGEPAGNKQA